MLDCCAGVSRVPHSAGCRRCRAGSGQRWRLALAPCARGVASAEPVKRIGGGWSRTGSETVRRYSPTRDRPPELDGAMGGVIESARPKSRAARSAPAGPVATGKGGTRPAARARYRRPLRRGGSDVQRNRQPSRPPAPGRLDRSSGPLRRDRSRKQPSRGSARHRRRSGDPCPDVAALRGLDRRHRTGAEPRQGERGATREQLPQAA